MLEELDLGWKVDTGPYADGPCFNHLTRIPIALLALPKLRRLRLDGNPLRAEELESFRRARPDCAVSFLMRMEIERCIRGVLASA